MNIAEHLQSNSYLNERLNPKPGEITYLHLSDLLIAVKSISTDERILILDYGCGGSPYKTFFPNADYRRADYLQNEGDQLDYVLASDSKVKEEDNTFDFILSTQVLEHLGNPSIYLQECHRLLKPGGSLYLTTHGFYPDHGCPYDFYRWTGDGLARELEAVGFELKRIEKQTTGPRALLHHLDYEISSIYSKQSSFFNLTLKIARKLYPRLRPWFHRMCDIYFPENRVVSVNLERHRTYIVIACFASKIH